jgi:hypothetical protein
MDYSKAKGVSSFLVRVDKTHKESVKAGDVEIFIDPKWREVETRVGCGIVEAPIDKCPNVKRGQKLWFHHKVTTIQTPQKIEDKVFYVAYTNSMDNCINSQAIATELEDGSIESVGWFVLVEPIGTSYEQLRSEMLELVQFSFDRQNIGRIAFVNDNVRSLGLNVGDKIIYYNSATYHVDINGKIYYRVRPQSVIGTIDE